MEHVTARHPFADAGGDMFHMFDAKNIFFLLCAVRN